MNHTQQLAKHFREVHSGGNWTWSNLQENLKDVTWEEAVTKVQGFNTIAALAYHIHYFVAVALKVLQGGPLIGKDSESFDHPPVESEKDWQQLLGKMWADAQSFADALEKLLDEKLFETFGQEKYGTYYRNMLGIIEHSHYHLGQIALIKKMVRKAREASE